MDKGTIYVVIHEVSYDYHLRAVSLVTAFFTEDAAQQYVRNHPDKGYRIEPVDLAPQVTN